MTHDINFQGDIDVYGSATFGDIGIKFRPNRRTIIEQIRRHRENLKRKGV